MIFCVFRRFNTYPVVICCVMLTLELNQIIKFGVNKEHAIKFSWPYNDYLATGIIQVENYSDKGEIITIYGVLK